MHAILINGSLRNVETIDSGDLQDSRGLDRLRTLSAWGGLESALPGLDPTVVSPTAKRLTRRVCKQIEAREGIELFTKGVFCQK